MLECVINISEGRDRDLIRSITRRGGSALLDTHVDADHNRCVVTLVGQDAARAVTETAIAVLDIRKHTGVHPRFGVVDVVPFVPLGAADLDDAVAARDRFADWAASTFDVPCFLYGPERTLPDVRRNAFVDLAPDRGPDSPHPTAGSIAVGARTPLIAYNLWLEEPDLDVARTIARSIRGPEVRALGLAVGEHVQVSMNLVEPSRVGPLDVYEMVASRTRVSRAELVGLIPHSVLERIPRTRWEQLDLSEEATIESRLGRFRDEPPPPRD